MQRRVEGQARVAAAHAVALGRELDVVPGREALELGPADPAGRERALVAARLQLGRRERRPRARSSAACSDRGRRP